MKNKPTEVHSFDVPIANVVGVEKAVILKEIYGWCRINEKKAHNIHEGFAWTYNPSRAYALHFPYLSKRPQAAQKKADRLIRELEDDGYIFAAKFHTQRGNHTKSHTVNWPMITRVISGQGYCPELATDFIELLCSNLSNRSYKNEQSRLSKNEQSRLSKFEQSYTPHSTPHSTPHYREEETSVSTVPKSTRFKEPSLDAVQHHFKEKLRQKKVLGAEAIAEREAEKFYNHYSANGWRVGKNKMKSWPHAVSGWISRMDQYQTTVNKTNKLEVDESPISPEDAHAIIDHFVAQGGF